MNFNKETTITIATNLTTLAINNTSLIKHDKTRNQVTVGLNILNILLHTYQLVQSQPIVAQTNQNNKGGL